MLLFLFITTLFLFNNSVLAADITVDNKDATKAPELTQTSRGIPQINIVNPENGLSHNRFEQYNVGSAGVAINNSLYDESVGGLGLVNANERLTESARTILFEVTGASRSELLGASTIVGSQANFILANPNGITCNGCNFINTHDVELRTDKLHSITDDGQTNWEQDLNSDINIGKNGVAVHDGSLTLSSGKIKIEGAVSAKELLRAEAHFVAAGKKQEYAIDINSVAPITAGKVYLVATGSGAGVKISASKFLVNTAYVETKDDDIAVEGINTNQSGNFKFVGKNFKNRGAFNAENVKFDLSGDFINEANGEITIKNNWNLASKGFANYKKIQIGNMFQVNADHFINDNGGNISAGSIGVQLANNLFQNSDSVLEAREGGVELATLAGDMYFGYKKEFTGLGDNKDGFKYVGSQLLSRKSAINIKSGGNIIFDGTQLLGNITAQAKGEIKENILSGTYKNGTHDVIQKENKTRIINKPVTKSRQVYDHTNTWPRGINTPFGAIGGWGHEDIYRTEYYIEQVPTQEEYVKETTTKEASFQDVFLKPNFIGNKQFFAKKADLNLAFNAFNFDKVESDEIGHLNFSSAPEILNKGYEYEL